MYPHAFPKPSNALSSAVTAANLTHLFSAIDASQDTTYQRLVPAHVATVTPLYPFQQRTVGWCLARELGTSASVRPQGLDEEQQLRFVCLKPPRMQAAVPGLWLDVLSEELVETVDENGPQVTQATSMVPPHDGFLAEEMGLGKSLIMLAVMLANPYSEPVARARSQFTTPSTDSSTTPAPKLVKTTLIVTPPALIAQWQSEIATHTPSLTVYVYQGGSRLPEDPHLGQYDVVLTTFRCLNGEFNLAQTDHGRSRRFERKYERPTSYLTACVFWRVVMDEAQMVGEASKVTQILCQIPRIHSWCMTGTPFSRSITADLTHLSRFLRHPSLPYDHLIARHHHLFTWYLRQIMHRTSKAHIKAELDLPPQQDVVVRLHLNAVEADSYEQVASGFQPQVPAALAMVDRGEPEMEVGETRGQFEARYRGWIEACAVLSQALSTLRLAANHPVLVRRLAGDVVGGGGLVAGAGGAGHGHAHGHGHHQRHAAEGDGAAGGGAQAFAIVNVLRDASLRNVSEYYRLQREMGTVKVKQAIAYDRLEEYDTAIDLLSTHLTHLGTLADSLAADKLLATTQSGPKHDVARISHLESELQLQIHQALFLLAGLHHVKGDEDKENDLYAQAEATRRHMLKEHIVQVEKVQAVVRRHVESERAGLDVQVVGQVKGEVDKVADEVADMVGRVEQQADDGNGEEGQVQRARPWAKPKSKADVEIVGKRNRKRKHPSQQKDEDEEDDQDLDSVNPELAGLYVMGGTLDDAVAVLDALEKQAALVDEWRPVLEAKLLTPLYRDQPAASNDDGDDEDNDNVGEGADQADEAGPSEYDLGLQSQHLAESHLAQLTLLVHDMRHITNRTAPLSAIDAQSSNASKRRRAIRHNKLTASLGEAVIDMLDMASLHESQLLADVADDSDQGLTHPEFERPLRQARLDAVVPVAGTSLAAVQQLLTRVAGDEQVELDRNERDRCQALAARIGSVIDHVLRQIGKVEAALVQYRKLFNARVVYFQELQEISDSVAVPDDLDTAQAEWIRTQYLPGCEARMRALEDVVPRVAARRRYLRMLLESYGDHDEGALEVECIVCAEQFENGYMTPCGHLACRACMRRWLQSQPTCPECRAHVRPSDLATVVMHVPAPAPPPNPNEPDPTSDTEDNEDDSTAAHAPAPSFPTALAHSLTTTSSPTLLPGWHYTSIHGHYGAKVSAVTQLVCTMMTREPAAKLLCFSQFEAILDVIKYSLDINNVPAVHFSPAAVHAFQTDRETKVLLLNAKSQAAGLTLNKARYILMVEPIANAAIDRQAITRVHRIGQHTQHMSCGLWLPELWRSACTNCCRASIETCTRTRRTAARMMTRIMDTSSVAVSGPGPRWAWQGPRARRSMGGMRLWIRQICYFVCRAAKEKMVMMVKARRSMRMLTRTWIGREGLLLYIFYQVNSRVNS
ncbi:SNF2 family N-terminal domain-domain-containing protein [Catenaria anguillulae PL171]|uniref:SNF2 family N-terminal domain-domain-containing protein n=1 Tax=Catenaria anguillulae PL171 TaxID=765915 RepID=A0A1Y2HKN8_9FUNG|nr:SNF2 family N-terminal domain-domain-containing protein [Catenaria anguillulae PL171]